MIVVLVGDEGAKALADLGEASEVHAVGFDPRGLTGRPVAIHTRTEAEVAQMVTADKVIGGDPALWNLAVHDSSGCVFADLGVEPPAPKRRGRPPKVK